MRTQFNIVKSHFRGFNNSLIYTSTMVYKSLVSVTQINYPLRKKGAPREDTRDSEGRNP